MRKLEDGLAILLVKRIDSRCRETPAVLEAVVLAGGEKDDSIQELLWIKYEIE